MFDVKFTTAAKKDLEKLSPEIQKRILKKIKFFSLRENPLLFSKPLVNLPPATHRFRVGDYRIAFYVLSKQSTLCGFATEEKCICKGMKSHLFIGIDPGKKTLKTTGVCIMEENDRGLTKIQTKMILRINIPRNPLPPAFMGDVIDNSMIIAEFLKAQGFELDRNIIETFYPLLRRTIKKTALANSKRQFKTPHELQAFYCAYVAYLHSLTETFWIGYEDGKVFLPKPKYWYKKSGNGLRKHS